MFPLLLVACDHHPVDAAPAKDEVAPGSIEGRACAPDSRTWAPDAVVTATPLEGGADIVGSTDVDGRFVLPNVLGDTEYEVAVRIGEVVVASEVVAVPAGETVALAEPACLDAFTQNLLVIAGTDSEAAPALLQAGVTTYTAVDGSDAAVVAALLDDPAGLVAYDMVLFEGGFVEDGVIHDVADPTNAAVAARIRSLRAFVEAGGALITTEAAYDVAEIGWPDLAEFVGSDPVPNDAELGDTAELYAHTGDESLAAFLGSEAVPVTYEVSRWPAVQNVAGEVTVLLSGTVPISDGPADSQLTASPLLYRFPAGMGVVTVSTFRLSADASEPLVETLRYTLHTR